MNNPEDSPPKADEDVPPKGEEKAAPERNFWGMEVKPKRRKRGQTHKHLTLAEE